MIKYVLLLDIRDMGSLRLVPAYTSQWEYDMRLVEENAGKAGDTQNHQKLCISVLTA